MPGLGHDRSGLVDDARRCTDEVVLGTLSQQYLLPVVEAEVEHLVEGDEHRNLECM